MNSSEPNLKQVAVGSITDSVRSTKVDVDDDRTSRLKDDQRLLTRSNAGAERSASFGSRSGGQPPLLHNSGDGTNAQPLKRKLQVQRSARRRDELSQVRRLI